MNDWLNALFSALAARQKTAVRRPEAPRVQRLPAAASPAPAAIAPRADAAPLGQRPVSNRTADSSAVAAAAERSLVRSLFAGPQSLAAALIAAEILAKPVALRDH